MRLLTVVVAILLSTPLTFAEPAEVPLVNPSFEGTVSEDGLPEGWQLYAGVGSTVSVVEGGVDGSKALLIDDANPGAEVGILQTFPLEGGQNALVRVFVKRATDAPTSGAYLQFRFFPSNTFRQIPLVAESSEEFNEIELFVEVPEGNERGRIYLYSHDAPTPKVMVDNVSVQSGVEAPKFPDGPAPEATPPQYDALKDLHLQTALVEGGEARAAIVTGADGRYAAEAKALQRAVADITGVELPVVGDEETTPPFGRNVIVLGRRETNAALRRMYEHFYTLVDAWYPGPGGHLVRTVHNPYADGHNAIVVGASEDAGVAAAADALVALLRQADAVEGELAVDQIAEIALSGQYEVPRDPTEMQIWEASNTYGSSGYFGWNIISKHMAAFYMTRDEYHAEEFLRLAFPGDEEIAELEKLDGERIENKHDPLAGPYHYSAHMMILFWDLIEEDPFFTDEQRLEITNALSRQLTHRAHEGVYGRTTPSSSVGNRHGDWSAMSLYALARYFDRDYPAPVWDAAKTSVDIYFDGIENSAWLAGNNDHLFWYTSYYDPLLDYIHLSGDRGGMENLRQALKTQDILFTGLEKDWGLRASSLNFLHRAADITGDGRFVFYRDRTGLDLDVFRLGQSWWPTIEARPPTELLDTWTMQPMPEPMWKARSSGLPLEQQFLWGTWRTTLDGTGDLMMIKGHNGGGRLPYHTFSVMEQRLAGYTLLKGYRNQVLTAADGMVEPQVAMNAALIDHGTLGDTAYAVGEVPKTAFANWRRSVIQREGQYALFVDDLTFRTDSDNVKVETEWQTVGGHWDAARNAMVIGGSSGHAQPELTTFEALDADISCGPGTADELLSDLTSIDTMLLKAHEPGVWMEMPFTLEEPVTGRVYADVLNHTDRGIISVALDGEVIVERYDHRAPATVRAQVDLGERTLEAGEHTLRIEVVEGHEDLDRMFVGLLGASILPAGAEMAPPLGFELHPSRVMDASGTGTVVMQWLGTAREGQHRRFFHLLAPKRGDEALEVYQLDESAAVLALDPGPALAVSGEFEGIAADAALLAVDHMVALGMTKLPFATASAPVDVRWDYEAGTMIVAADEAAELTVGERSFTLQPGTQTLEGGRVQDLGWMQHVADLLEQARAEREQQLAARAQPETVEAAEMAPAVTAEIAGTPVDAVVIPRENGDLVALAQGQTVHIVAADGSEMQTLETDGPIRVLRWWAEPELLLVGCEDEQVIAFNLESGDREWVFTSEMDRAVWEAGKQYWFKSAYPGIHGLHSGMFGDESLAFVGSACTLEILNAQGELVKRLPIFWGNGWKFRIVDGPDDTRNLLIARWPNGSDTLAIVNSESLKRVGGGYYGVPEGHTMIGGWTAQNRTGIEYVDVDGDGTRELVSTTNGVWNRVTVFSGDGAPLFNAQFGPGDNAAPYRTMRDMAVADLDGDGDMEILVGTADGLVVTLDHQCRKVWAKRLPSPPTQLEVLAAEGAAPTVIAGCEDGSILSLTADGEMVAVGTGGGRIETLVTVATPQGPMAVAAAADGIVTGWRGD